LVGHQGQRPVVGRLLHHAVRIDGLHVRVGGELEAVGVVEFFEEGGVGAFIGVDAYEAALIETAFDDLLHLVLLEVDQQRLAHLEELLLDRVLVHRDPALLLVIGKGASER